MTRVFIEKADTPEDIARRIGAAEENEVVLVVPKNADLAKSVKHFRMLQKEAAETGKTLSIESVDEKVLKIAKTAGITATHPLFEGAPRGRILSDIVPVHDVAPQASRTGEKVAHEETPKGPQKKYKKIEVVSDPALSPDALLGRGYGLRGVVEEDPAGQSNQRDREKPTISLEDDQRDVSRAGETHPRSIEGRKRRRFFRPKALLVVVLVAVVAGSAVWGVNAVFGKATVAVRFKKTPWQHEERIKISKTVAEASESGAVLIPAQVFTDRRNITQTFPASGRASVSLKATGKILIQNAFSSEPQPLVATTRFVTPSGLVFRLDRQVTVPGAKIQGGKIIPASVEAAVTADKAGADYNTGPVERLSIPGFKGTPKYDGFFGSLTEGASGGFVGEKEVPTDADVKTAQKKVEDTLKVSLANNFLTNRPDDLIIIDGASEVSILKMTVNKVTDANGNFGVFGEAQIRAIAFREADLVSALEARAGAAYGGKVFHEVTMEYGEPKPNFDRGEIEVSLVAQGMLVPPFAPDAFKGELLGKKVRDIQKALVQLPELADAKISLWPRWLLRMPRRAERVTITVN